MGSILQLLQIGRSSAVGLRDDAVMVGAFRFSVPPEVAEDLIAEGVAIQPVDARGVGEWISFIVDGVNTGASVVTLSAAAIAARRASHRLARYLRERHGQRPVDVVIRGPKGERALRIQPAASLEDTTEALRVALDAVRAEAAKPPD